MLQTAYSGRRWSLEDTAVQDRWFILGTVGIVFFILLHVNRTNKLNAVAFVINANALSICRPAFFLPPPPCSLRCCSIKH